MLPACQEWCAGFSIPEKHCLFLIDNTIVTALNIVDGRDFYISEQKELGNLSHSGMIGLLRSAHLAVAVRHVRYSSQQE